MKTLKKNALTRLGSRWLLLVASAFLFGQSLALGHLHLDGEIGVSCAVCHHADDSPAIAATASLGSATAVKAVQQLAFPPLSLPVVARRDNLTRAPPQTFNV